MLYTYNTADVCLKKWVYDHLYLAVVLEDLEAERRLGEGGGPESQPRRNGSQHLSPRHHLVLLWGVILGVALGGAVGKVYS